jgi:hypothetical protein
MSVIKFVLEYLTSQTNEDRIHIVKKSVRERF